MAARFLALGLVLIGMAAGPVSAEPRLLAQNIPEPGGPNGPAGPGRPSYWGAIGFTADGSYSSAWKAPSKAEAEAKVAVECSKFGRGKCEVVSFPGELCVGLAHFSGTSGRRRWQLSFTASGPTTPDAQKAALERCNSDQRTNNRCQLRIVVCGDGR